ncbi:MAG: cytochrome C biogenesis protein CcmH [Alphaproteobacteria bacterium RIFOXYD12_FULL_60_8]|nr:MAG: cytochrome C biogenesis protein CcmH [Alphaproteobacteria bacterium RIFOXYD12_FULL_60_8]
MRTIFATLLVCSLAFVPLALAVQPDEMLADPALEARAREVSQDLRCVVCQNQSIDDSDAELARSMRLLVRERLTAGDSNDQVVQYLVDRYGDFVRLNPPFKATTLVLWLGPLAFAVIALLAGVTIFRRRAHASKNAAPAPLTEDERRHINAMLKDGDAP